MKLLYDKVSNKCSKVTTHTYSTSFSIGIRLLSKEYRTPVYAIYGFVRLADEIVDSFHDYDKVKLFYKFKEDTYEAINNEISLNPVLNSFQYAVNQYNIDNYLIETFLNSMEMDLTNDQYNKSDFDQYILGSAEVVGLMCLKIFCNGDDENYRKLKPHAMKLGAAFQKINFLRDIQTDMYELGRSYFPNINIEKLDGKTKRSIENEIEKDFSEGFKGIPMLPEGVRLGVYVAYVYYFTLFKKIKKAEPAEIMNKRIRVPNNKKFLLLINSYFKHSFNIL